MKYDFQFVLLLCFIGIIFRRLSWKGWFAVGLLVTTWIGFNWMKG